MSPEGYLREIAELKARLAQAHASSLATSDAHLAAVQMYEAEVKRLYDRAAKLERENGELVGRLAMASSDRDYLAAVFILPSELDEIYRRALASWEERRMLSPDVDRLLHRGGVRPDTALDHTLKFLQQIHDQEIFRRKRIRLRAVEKAFLGKQTGEKP